MPEEAPGADEATQETPESGPETQAPAEGTPQEQPTPADPYQKRYEDLRSQYDRIHPRLNQYEEILNELGNPETQAEALQRYYGVQLQEEEDEEEYDPDDDEPMTRAEFQEWQQEQAQEAANAEAQEELADLASELIDVSIADIEKDLGQPLSDRYKRILVATAFDLEDEEGLPDFDAAQEELQAELDERHKSYIESKKAPRVEVGQAGSEKVNLADDNVRVQLLADMVEAGEQAES